MTEEEKLAFSGNLSFNGTKFGKGRYKAHHKNETLDITN
jgi:hypothetical protein